MPLLPGGGEVNPQNSYDTELAPQLEPFAGIQKCPVGAPEANYDSSDQNQNLGQCTVAPVQNFVPADCTSPKKAMVAQKLAVIDLSFKTSRSPQCTGENEVVFWLAHLSPDQAAMILAETDGAVEGIGPNFKFKSGPPHTCPGIDGYSRNHPQINTKWVTVSRRSVAFSK